MTASTLTRYRAERLSAARAFQRRKLERLLQGDDLSLEEIARVIEGIPALRQAVLERGVRGGGSPPTTVVESLRLGGLGEVLPLLR